MILPSWWLPRVNPVPLSGSRICHAFLHPDVLSPSHEATRATPLAARLAPALIGQLPKTISSRRGHPCPPACFHFLFPPVLMEKLKPVTSSTRTTTRRLDCSQAREETSALSSCHDRSTAFRQAGFRRALRGGVTHTMETVLQFHRLRRRRARHVGPEQTQNSERHVFDPDSLYIDAQAEPRLLAIAPSQGEIWLLSMPPQLGPRNARSRANLPRGRLCDLFRAPLPDDGHDFGPPRPCQRSY